MRARPVLLLPGSRPASRPRRSRRVVALLTALGLVLAVTFSASGAGAQTVGDLRARAERIANELEQLEAEGSRLNEAFLALEEELAEVRSERDRTAAAVDEAQQRVDAAQGEAADYLVEAYIGAGSGAALVLGSSDPNETVNSRFLMQFLRGDRQVLAETISANKGDLEDRRAELDRVDERLEQRQREQRRVVEQLEASVARHSELLASTNSQLEQAIEAERRRREAEAAARAEAEARAQAAARQAAAQEAEARQSATRARSDRSTTRAAPAPERSAAPAPPAPAAPLPASPPNGRGGAAVAAAMTQMGKAYRWGGSTPATGFDCSGLTSWAWAQAGVGIPRTSGAQRAATQRITVDQLQPGDLVFFGSPVHHVGMYVGNGQMIHSPRTGSVIHIASIHRGFGSATSYGRVR